MKPWIKRAKRSIANSWKKAIVARKIKERLTHIVSYCKHGIANAVAEGINSKIMVIEQRVGGYRNKENFNTAIYFYCGARNRFAQGNLERRLRLF